jgi:hypothetical protein
MHGTSVFVWHAIGINRVETHIKISKQETNRNEPIG